MLREEDLFLEALGGTSVGAFNRLSVAGDVPRMVRVVEGFEELRGRVVLVPVGVRACLAHKA